MTFFLTLAASAAAPRHLSETNFYNAGVLQLEFSIPSHSANPPFSPYDLLTKHCVTYFTYCKPKQRPELVTSNVNHQGVRTERRIGKLRYTIRWIEELDFFIKDAQDM